MTAVQSVCPGLILIIPKTSGMAHMSIIRAIQSSETLHNQRASFSDPIALKSLLLAAEQIKNQRINWRAISEGGFCGIEFYLTKKDGKVLSAKVIKK